MTRGKKLSCWTRVRFFIKAYSVLVTAAIYFVLFFTFINAYMNPEKYTIVWIDKFGEANIELVILLVITPMIFYTVYILFKGGKLY